MQPPQKHSWINLAELKNQLTKNLGPERSQQYFDYLKRFLSLKLSKIEFNKLCLRTIGKDNIPLHNQLICSILKNAVGNKKGPHGNGSIPVVHSKHPNESFGKKSEKEVYTSPSLHAPFGIPCWRVSGSRKASSSLASNSDTGCLIETVRLKERMDQLAATQSLQVSMDCASVLNNGLDVYLKGLIQSISELSGSRSGSDPMKSGSVKHQAHFRALNGYRPGYFNQMQEREPKRLISLLDLNVAMELNPQQLGVDWPILLEKICTHGFEK